jgi:hypothetical protein
VIAVLKAPKISVVKEANGKMNILELLKVEDPQAALGSDLVSPVATASGDSSEVTDTVSTVAASGQPAAAPASGRSSEPPPETEPAPQAETAEPAKVPALVAGATLGLRIEKGGLHYLDKGAKSEYRVNDLALDARNLGLGSTMTVKLTAPMDGKMPDLTFSGPVQLFAEITPVLVGTEVKSAKGRVELDATRLVVDMPGKFRKTASMALTAKAAFDGDEKETLLRLLEVQLP